ncbi:MAG: TraR/DksA family transcriptional regulator [Vicinamibacterales bacterium]
MTELAEILRVRQRELQRALGVRLHDVRESHGHLGQVVNALDMADASNAELQQDIGIAMTELAADALARVDEALTRLASGAYGRCLDCEGEIAEIRLAALPFAVRCRECEELKEVYEARTRSEPTRRHGPLVGLGGGGRD